MRNTSVLLIVAGIAWYTPSVRTTSAADAKPSDRPDEVVLREAGVGTENKQLLEFLAKNNRAEDRSLLGPEDQIRRLRSDDFDAHKGARANYSLWVLLLFLH